MSQTFYPWVSEGHTNYKFQINYNRFYSTSFDYGKWCWIHSSKYDTALWTLLTAKQSLFWIDDTAVNSNDTIASGLRLGKETARGFVYKLDTGSNEAENLLKSIGEINRVGFDF